MNDIEDLDIDIFKSSNRKEIIDNLRKFLVFNPNGLNYGDFSNYMKKYRLYNQFRINQYPIIWRKANKQHYNYIKKEDLRRFAISKFTNPKIRKLAKNKVKDYLNSNLLIYEKDKPKNYIKYEKTYSQEELIKQSLKQDRILSTTFTYRELNKMKHYRKKDPNFPFHIILIRKLEEQEKEIEGSYYTRTRTKHFYETKKAIELTKTNGDLDLSCKYYKKCKRLPYSVNCNYCNELNELKTTYIRKINKSFQIFYYSKEDRSLKDYLKKPNRKLDLEETKGDHNYMIFLKKTSPFNTNTLQPKTSNDSITKMLRRSHLKQSKYESYKKEIFKTMETRRKTMRYLKPFKIWNFPHYLIKWVKVYDNDDPTDLTFHYELRSNGKCNTKIKFYNYFDDLNQLNNYEINLIEMLNYKITKEKEFRLNIINRYRNKFVNLLNEYSNRINKRNLFYNVENGISKKRSKSFGDNNIYNDYLVYKHYRRDLRVLKNSLNRLSKKIDKLKEKKEELKSSKSINRYNHNIKVYENIYNRLKKIYSQTNRVIVLNNIDVFYKYKKQQRLNFYEFFLYYLFKSNRKNLDPIINKQLNEIYQYKHKNNEFHIGSLQIQFYKELRRYFNNVFDKCIFPIIFSLKF